jgi:hypothetical protein
MQSILNSKYLHNRVGLGDLGVKCSPRDPRFAGSYPAEVDEFFQDIQNVKFPKANKLWVWFQLIQILNTSPPGGTLSGGS